MITWAKAVGLVVLSWLAAMVLIMATGGSLHLSWPHGAGVDLAPATSRDAAALLGTGTGGGPAQAILVVHEGQELVGWAHDYDSGPVDLEDGGVYQCHRQCKAILGPGGSQMDGGEYPFRCGPCLIFCSVVDNGTREIVALVATDAGCAAWGDGGPTWFGGARVRPIPVQCVPGTGTCVPEAGRWLE